MQKTKTNNFNIFIVDDDMDFAESVAEVLEYNDYNIDIAYTGEEAIDKSKQNDYDIILMDLKLPGKNGVESFLEIRQAKPHIKVMIMTGYRDENLLKKALQNGVFAILHKPLNMDDMLNMIKKVDI